MMPGTGHQNLLPAGTSLPSRYVTTTESGKAAMYSIMSKTSLAALAVAVFAVGSIGEAKAVDYQACYKVEGLHNSRVVLNISRHSNLRTWRAGRQVVYEADGKHTRAYSRRNTVMAVFDGAIVTSRGGGGQVSGSHLGGVSLFVRGGRGIGPKGGPSHPIYWECTSRQRSPAPSVWYCSIQSDSYKRTLPAKLIKLRRPDRHCDIYQDTVRNRH